jgi:hypothetical protein
MNTHKAHFPTRHKQYIAMEEAVKKARSLGYADYSPEMRKMVKEALEKVKRR